ncbi:uncharacterized protein LOC110699125 [Chenopodium quinoa]|uniref:uncharacterized protein LOC110699125 n=1 Tax=Chenopodium quinoa TaxID=63459 RepID=UPI000B792896|nr:uncharacterized protein LOC110699125 [Chenopodium quinoa]
MNCRILVDNVGGWTGITVNGKMSIRQLYTQIRPQVEKVTWKRIICNNRAFAKSVFITWLAIWNRLVTKDRLTTLKITCDPLCFFCASTAESVSHLFFECSYSASIWNKILQLLGFCRIGQRFDSEVLWVLQQGRRATAKGRLLLMCFAETIHCIWIQRNTLMFTGDYKPADIAFREVIFSVACRCIDSDRKYLYV